MNIWFFCQSFYKTTHNRACPSRDVPKGKVKSVDICGQKIAIFRGEDGKVRALDAYCRHMGTDLGIGQVDGNLVRCFFHHWTFDGKGKCQDIPCQKAIPEKAKIQAYDTEEKYDFIWVYPDTKATEPVAEFDELKDKPIKTLHDKAFERSCHHHICMMNGIDAQHLQTIHNFHINMELFLHQNQSGTTVDFTLKGELPKTTLKEQIARKTLGLTYEYSMRYANGCIGLLTTMKNVKFLPELHMIFAYNPVSSGRTRIYPIYITENRKGIFGWFWTRILLLLTKVSYYSLKNEDGKIYDNIQFN